MTLLERRDNKKTSNPLRIRGFASSAVAFFDRPSVFEGDSEGGIDTCPPSPRLRRTRQRRREFLTRPYALDINFLYQIGVLFPEFPPLQKESFSSIRDVGSEDTKFDAIGSKNFVAKSKESPKLISIRIYQRNRKPESIGLSKIYLRSLPISFAATAAAAINMTKAKAFANSPTTVRQILSLHTVI